LLRKISGPKRDEVIGEWRRYVEVYDLLSPNICLLIKLTRMSWGSIWHVWEGKEWYTQRFGGET
jgi:hypothetical protein